jgi:dolichol kinase
MRMLVILVLIISATIIIILSSTFRILITEYEMKPNKLTKLFYSDDKNFIKAWKETKEKGILTYSIKTGAIYTAGYGTSILIILSKDNNSIMYGREHILLLVMVIIIFSLLSSLIGWRIGKDRYSKLK